MAVMSPRRRSRHTNGPYLLAQALLVLLPLLYVLLHTASGYLNHPRFFDITGELIGRIFEAVVILWGFAVGACLGSFLNVVALRAPRGETIGGGSYCPYCTAPIRSRDNIPILGWLGLRGRCYACHLPISPRYMIVEIIAGSMVASIVAMQLIPGGVNFPSIVYSNINPPRLVMRWDQLLVFRTLFHCLVLLWIMTTALVVGSRLKIPPLMLIAGTLLTLIPPLAYPKLLILTWQSQSFHRLEGLSLYLEGVTTLAAGGAAALLLALITAGSMYRVGRYRSSTIVQNDQVLQSSGAQDWGWQLLWLGFVFGWQAVLGIGVLWCLGLAALYLWLRKYRFSLIYPPSLIFVAAWLHLLCWRELIYVPIWPGGAWFYASALFGLAIPAVLSRLLVPHDWQQDMEPKASSMITNQPTEQKDNQTESVEIVESKGTSETGIDHLTLDSQSSSASEVLPSDSSRDETA
jgi:leader peptidase (prepilin peptidase)/N-methyltransferase